MRWRGASLSRRLLIGAALFIAAAMAIAAVVIFLVLHRFVQGQVDQRLDTHIAFLGSMLHADAAGVLTLSGDADGPPFDRPRRGWYWHISGPANELSSRSLAGAPLILPDVSGRPLPPPRRGPEAGRPLPPVPADGLGPDNAWLHFRLKTVTVDGVRATIAASAPRAAVMGPLREAMVTLALSMVALGVALVLAMLLQVRLGLRPLERLRLAIADVRNGRSPRLPEDQPREIAPLVAELNELLRQNAVNLERARGHVANLAHGLKTPLATLAIALRKEPANPELNALVVVMQQRIRHHLARARAAALGGSARAHTLAAVRIDDLALVLGKAHAEKGVRLINDVAHDLSVACEAQDFDEMAGNLLENAFQWARGVVLVRAEILSGREIALHIEDDGPGLTPSQMDEVLQAGRRLDETVPGFGFGLSIARELAELYGGSLTLGRAAAGGLAATLRLPSVRN